MQAGGLKDGMTAALDRMPLAAILADRFGRAVWLNRPAEELVRHADGLRLRDGRIEATANNGVSAELRRLILGAAAVATDGAGARIRARRPRTATTSRGRRRRAACCSCRAHGRCGR